MAVSQVTGGWGLNVNAPASQDTSLIYNDKNQRKDAGFAYDAAGNVTGMNLFSNIQYDAENRMVNESSPSAFAYGYDGDGRRVVKADAGGNRTLYVYDAFGQLWGGLPARIRSFFKRKCCVIHRDSIFTPM